MESINLVPITKLKMSKEVWLQKKLKYDNILTISDIIEQMCERTYAWISLKDDLDIVSLNRGRFFKRKNPVSLVQVSRHRIKKIARSTADSILLILCLYDNIIEIS